MTFRFKIGELVYAKVGIADAMLSCRAGEISIPKVYLILETLGQSCPGGEQMSYKCSQGGASAMMHEVELAALSEWDHAAAMEALVSAQATKDERQQQALLARLEARAKAKKDASPPA